MASVVPTISLHSISGRATKLGRSGLSARPARTKRETDDSTCAASGSSSNSRWGQACVHLIQSGGRQSCFA